PLVSVPLVSVPLVSVPLVSVPLVSVPLVSVPLVSVPLLSPWGVLWTVASGGDCAAAMAVVAPAEMRSALLMQEAQISRGIRPRAVVVMMTP
ncbi:hypothetical protein ACFW2G_06500, partial [Streptomyces sp. NPDC058880]|uniref:hypothetical protein n=1 Tax=Streptomyces sp. NPDC058880 TaxID=3346666 RepID=UPI0036CEBC3F